jgi:D-glycero-D-manno-heptose 1,7-bisphosphate phosphatase
MHKAIFLDRDGVINRKAITEDDYVTSWEEMEILPGVPEAIAHINRAGFQVIIVTNQRSIAKGLITAADLESIHLHLSEYLLSKGATIDAIYYCPHELEPPCGCRKPEPGMLFNAAGEHNIDLAASWMIGDSEKDVDAGRRAGCKTARIAPESKSMTSKADIVASTLLAAVHKILAFDSNSTKIKLFESAARG